MVALNVTTSPVHALQTVNDLTIVSGVPLLSMSILVMIWFIIYTRSGANSGAYNIGFSDLSVAKLAVATVYTSIIAIFFAFMGLLPDQITGMFIALGILSVIPLVYRSS